MDFIKFKASAEVDGTYTAKAVGYDIFTEGDTYEALKRNIEEAIECHFGEQESAPKRFDLLLEESVQLRA